MNIDKTKERKKERKIDRRKERKWQTDNSVEGSETG